VDIMLHFCVMLCSMYLTNRRVSGQAFLTLPIKLEKPATLSSVPLWEEILLIVLINF